MTIKCPEEVRKYIEDFAKYKDMQISASQPESVFSVPPFEKDATPAGEERSRFGTEKASL